MSKSEFPWWLEVGAGSCPFCESRLHVEALVYCTDCDRPVCATCMKEAPQSHRALCPECYAGAGAIR